MMNPGNDRTNMMPSTILPFLFEEEDLVSHGNDDDFEVSTAQDAPFDANRAPYSIGGISNESSRLLDDNNNDNDNDRQTALDLYYSLSFQEDDEEEREEEGLAWRYHHHDANDHANLHVRPAPVNPFPDRCHQRDRPTATLGRSSTAERRRCGQVNDHRCRHRRRQGKKLKPIRIVVLRRRRPNQPKQQPCRPQR